MEVPKGKVRVGSCHWKAGKRVDPTYPGYTNIVSLTVFSEYGMLSPYCLMIKVKIDGQEQNVIFENYYQASKCYEVVPEACEVKSRFDRTIIWKWPREEHVKTVKGVYQIQPAYLNWRKALMLCPEPVRYPVGKHNTHKCLFALKQNEDGSLNPNMLDYISGRKEIYLKEFVKLLKVHPEFLKLKERLHGGESLLIVEVDCCQERSLDYYKEKYGVGNDFIENGTMLATEYNLNLLLNDTKERWGHGMVIAGALQDIY